MVAALLTKIEPTFQGTEPTNVAIEFTHVITICVFLL